MNWSTIVAALKKCRLHFLLLLNQIFFDAPHIRVAKAMAALACFYRAHGLTGKAEQYWWRARLMLETGQERAEAHSLGMYQVVDGVHTFQRKVFKKEKELFEQLSLGQHPDVLLITCSDSRIASTHVTQSRPGELFVLRNAGNIVPQYGTASGSEAATIEFAVKAIGVKDIIIAGHSHCGAMKGLLNPQKTEQLPATTNWLMHAAKARERVFSDHHSSTEDEQLLSLIKENVRLQIEHLKSHPAVSDAVESGQVRLHGWVYKIESGEVLSFNAIDQVWQPL